MANIEKRNDSYRIKIFKGTDSNGKKMFYSMTWKPPPNLTEKQIEKELKRVEVEFEKKCKTGQFLDETIKLSEYAEKWLKDYAEMHLRTTTLVGYKIKLKRIIEQFGHMKLCDIMPHHLTEFYKGLSGEGQRRDIKYKPITDIDALMKSRNISQNALSKLSGASVQAVKTCRDGENTSAQCAEKISKALGVKVKDLFETVEPVGRKKLSGTSILQYHRILSSMFSTAVQWQILFSNPCERVKSPKMEHTEAKFLDEVQATELLKALEDEPFQYQVMIQTLLFGGMRRGELLGLSWEDIDFKRNLIHITKSSLYTAEKGVFDDTTKTKSSKRAIKVPVRLMQQLHDYKNWQSEYSANLGDYWQESGRLFTNDKGEPLFPDTVSKWFSDFIKRKNLTQIPLKGLRHSNASIMIASGVNIKTVSSRLGHSNVSVTGNIYTHQIKSADEAAAEILENVLSF